MLDALGLVNRATACSRTRHELRTPLTSLRTNVEVLARAHDLAAPEERERLVADIVAQIEELGARRGRRRARAGQEPEREVEDVRLDGIVAEAVERAELHAPDVLHASFRRVALVRRRRPAARAGGRQPARQRGQVEPSRGGVEGAPAPGRGHAARPRPGNRRRGTPHRPRALSRAPAARPAGSGLGLLAIVRQIAEAHGTLVTAESADGGGALLRLRLPLAHLRRLAAGPAGS